VPFDPYQTLGVPRWATDDEVRQAYRALARKFHPDVNKSPGAEDHFKLLGQAYSILSDPGRRALFDEFGEASLSIQFDAERARAERAGQDRGPGQRRRARAESSRGDPGTGSEPEPGRRANDSSDVVSQLEVNLLTAIEGGELRIDSPIGGAPLRVQLPRNVESGHQLRLKGRGRAGRRGGMPGDLLLEVVVRPHPFFRREGRDLVLDLPVTLTEAWQGATVEVPSLDGWIRVPIPAGSRGGERLRLRGKGIPDEQRGRGDLYVHLSLRLPDRIDSAGRALERLATLYSEDVRSGLRL
jgi:curved DNA-binding protein